MVRLPPPKSTGSTGQKVMSAGPSGWPVFLSRGFYDWQIGLRAAARAHAPALEGPLPQRSRVAPVRTAFPAQAYALPSAQAQMEPVGRQPARAVRRGPGGMAAPLRALPVAGGGESSESEDDGWEIGYLDRTAQVAKQALSWPHLDRPYLPMKPLSSLPVFP